MSLAARRALQAPIRVWRRFFAPALPPMCRFYPSCSAYAIEALEKHSIPRALFLIVWRLARCTPFHPGGFDPVPEPGAGAEPPLSPAARPR